MCVCALTLLFIIECFKDCIYTEFVYNSKEKKKQKKKKKKKKKKKGSYFKFVGIFVL